MAFCKGAFAKGAASVQTIFQLAVAATSMRRFKLDRFQCGINASPADNAFNVRVQRSTVQGTGTARTVTMNDPIGDTLASTLQFIDTVTADGTLTANAFEVDWSFNQRTSVQWVPTLAGGEIWLPPTASNGIALVYVAASTTTATGSWEGLEL